MGYATMKATQIAQAAGERLAARGAAKQVARGAALKNAKIRAAVRKTFEDKEIQHMSRSRLDELHFDLNKTRQRERLVRGSDTAQAGYRHHYKVAQGLQTGARVAARTGLGAGVGFLAGGPIGATIGGGLGLASGVHSAKNPSLHMMKERHKYALKQAVTGEKRGLRLQKRNERRLARFRKHQEKHQAIMGYKREFREGMDEAAVTGAAGATLRAIEAGLPVATRAAKKLGRVARLKQAVKSSKYVQSSLPRLKKTGNFLISPIHAPATAKKLAVDFGKHGSWKQTKQLSKQLGKQALAAEVVVGGGLYARHKAKNAMANYHARQQEGLDEGLGTVLKAAGAWFGKSKNVGIGAKQFLKARKLPVKSISQQRFASSVKKGAWQTAKSGLVPAAAIAAGTAGAGYGAYRGINSRRMRSQEEEVGYMHPEDREFLIEAIIEEAVKEKLKKAYGWSKEKAKAGVRAVGKGGKWAGKKMVASGKAVGKGGKWAGKKVAVGGKWSGKKIVAGGKAVGKGGKWLAKTKKGRLVAAGSAAAGAAGYGAYRYAKKHKK